MIAAAKEIGELHGRKRGKQQIHQTQHDHRFHKTNRQGAGQPRQPVSNRPTSSSSSRRRRQVNRPPASIQAAKTIKMPRQTSSNMSGKKSRSKHRIHIIGKNEVGRGQQQGEDEQHRQRQQPAANQGGRGSDGRSPPPSSHPHFRPAEGCGQQTMAAHPQPARSAPRPCPDCHPAGRIKESQVAENRQHGQRHSSSSGKPLARIMAIPAKKSSGKTSHKLRRTADTFSPGRSATTPPAPTAQTTAGKCPLVCRKTASPRPSPEPSLPREFVADY